MTCQRLRHIPQEVMFHDIHLSRGISRLLRTLLERPDLASQVRRFSNDQYTDSSSVDELYPTLLNTLIARFSLDDAWNEYGNWISEISLDDFEREIGMLEMTVALLNKATALSLTIPADDFEYKCVFGKLFMKSSTMSSVRRLFLSHNDHSNSNRKLDLGCLGNFLGMMPCLERLDVSYCWGTTQFLPLYELRSLIFDQSNISAASLKRLVMSCPKLERFE
ncbi:hypothetical protein ACHAPE_005903 [Trichoderma viride]